MVSDIDIDGDVMIAVALCVVYCLSPAPMTRMSTFVEEGIAQE